MSKCCIAQVRTSPAELINLFTPSVEYAMNRPWEVMMNFQKRLRSGASGVAVDGLDSTQAQISSAAHQFLPSSSHLPTRLPRVRNIINESTKVIEQSRLPELNTTAVSFCQNCACDNCSNLSMLNETQQKNPNINTLVQTFENFLQFQKQQFLAMIQQVADASGMDTSASVSCNQLSKELTKSMVAATSGCVENSTNGGARVTRSHAASSSSPQLEFDAPGSSPKEMDEMLDSTVFVQEDKPKDKIMNLNACYDDAALPIIGTAANTEDDKPIALIDIRNNSEDQKEPLSGSSHFDSFDDYLDDSFRPVRRSSLMKMRRSFVLLEKVPDGQHHIKPFSLDRTEPSVKNELPTKSEFKVPAVPENRKKAVAVSTFDVPCTRFGRAVKKPQAYWTAGSRVDTAEVTAGTKPGAGPRKKYQTNPESSHSARGASKNISAKKRKMEVETIEASSINLHEALSSAAVKAQEVSNVSKTRKKCEISPDLLSSAKSSSKNVSVKKSKMETQTVEASSVNSRKDLTKSQEVSKGTKKRCIQNENAFAASNNTKKVIQQDSTKTDTLKKKTSYRKGGNSRKPTKLGKSNSILQLQKRNLRRTSENSFSEEPEYECYYGDALSD